MIRLGFTCLSLMISLGVMASSEGGHQAAHHPSIADLAWPAVNFVVLVVGLIYILRKPLSEGFTKKSSEVEKLINYAQEKDKEAQIKLDMYEKKLASLDSQQQKINQEMNEDFEKFKQTLMLETENEKTRLQRDIENKFESEKKKLLSQINSELLDNVINEAKKQIAGNGEFKKKATEKMLSSLH